MYTEWEAPFMETAYEKVCPACGRSATLAAKFCSGCGHQYRTVFHDQAAETHDDAAEDTGTNFDARWAPIVAITPVVIVMFIVASRPTAVPVSVAPAQTAVTTYQAPSGTVSYGMSYNDVQQSLGQPTDIKTGSIAGVDSQDWYYRQADGHTVEVHFNGQHVVDTWHRY